MGAYLIPNAGEEDIRQVIDHVREQGALTDGQVWDWGAEGGTLFTDPDRTDAECAALYAGFSPDPEWLPALPSSLRAHAGHLRDYEQAIRDGTPVTAAQTQHVIADLITYLRLTEPRL